MGKPSNHSQLLDYLKNKRVKCKGVVVNSQYNMSTLRGEWRNDTDGYVILTGLFADYDTFTVPDEINLQVGDRQITGGFVSMQSLVSIGSTENAPVEWPGYGVPVAPGEVVRISTDTAGTGTNIQYTFCAVATRRWKPETMFLESRFNTLTPAAITGQQTVSVQIGYPCIVWDWFRAVDDMTNYKASTLCRLSIDDDPITLNSISSLGIPVNVYNPSSAIMLPKKKGFNVRFYIDANTASLQPSIAVRFARFWGV